MRVKSGVAFLLTLTIFLALVYFVSPPGEPPMNKENHEAAGETPLVLSYGSLPGVTWADDIHPIFVRNKCGHCHTRGKEAIAEGFEELALGIVDPEDENNDYYSYHELVYAEGLPQIQDGESLRDGQCCWPRKYSPENQRRIWIGHPEKSVLMRKLDRDYFDWDRPPRFFEEGLKLKWGSPMPMYREGEAGHEDHGSEGNGQRQYDIRPFYERIFLNLSLWIGGSRDELRQWPEQISESDRTLLRYWINNTVQLMEEGTGIEVEVINEIGEPVNNAKVRLAGNYNSVRRKEVADLIELMSDSEGKVILSFPESSVITSTWFVAAEKDGVRSDYEPLHITHGNVSKAVVMF